MRKRSKASGFIAGQIDPKLAADFREHCSQNGIVFKWALEKAVQEYMEKVKAKK